MRYLFLTLALLSGAVSAEEYYWQMPGKADRYDSASAGCEALRASARQPAEIVSFVKRENVEIYDCRIRRPASSGVGTIATTYQLNRYGDSCPSGTTYDPSVVDGSSQCVPDPEPDKCLDTQGTTNYNISHAGLRADFPPGSPVAPINPRMCDDSCAYQYAGDGSTTNCGTLRDADPAQYYCVFKYTGIGEACLPGDEPINANAPPNPDPPVDPNDPTDPRNNCGRGYAWSGTTCVRYWDPDNPTDPSNPDPGGGNNGGGNTGGGNNGGGNNGGDTGGTDPGTGNGGGGGGGNDGGDGDGDGAPTEKLEQGEQGSFDEALKEWDEKIADIQVELDQKIAEYTGLFSGVFDLNLGGSGGSLPCYNVPIKIGSASTSGKLCIADYERELSFLRYILLLVAAVVAAFIVLRD
jgi:hypothetical protein